VGFFVRGTMAHMNARYRWFRPTIPCMLLGFLIGWSPSINGDDMTDAAEGFMVGFLGFCIGNILDGMVHNRD
jgi:hypothetical protein